MKTNPRLRYFVYLSILLIGCTTGKNALQKGNYDASLTKAINRLKSSSKNKEALSVLGTAYSLATQNHLRKIDEAKQSVEVLRWETVLAEYEALNGISDEINSCPACLAIVPNPQKFIKEVTDSKLKAAEVRYALGIKALQENNRTSAKKAYYDFEKVARLVPNFKDIERKLDEAYAIAVTVVVVKPAVINSNMYKLSNDYFQQQVNNYLTSYKQNSFVRFYTQQQAKTENIRADELLQLNFDDFVVGQTYVKEKVEKLKRDSVIIGQTRTKQNVYGTVKATYSVFEKNITSSGLLNYAIIDLQTNKVLRNNKLAGTYIWSDTWASYKGDERALNKQQLALARRDEVLPPPPLNLFVEFTKPIYNQLVNEINNFYRNY
jgi:hypothetical protein